MDTQPSSELSTSTTFAQNFISLGDMTIRNSILTHEYWDKPNIHDLVEADMLSALVSHIADCALHYYNAKKSGALLRGEAGSYFEASRGLLWGTGEHWGKWQARVIALKKELDWPSMERHFNTILSQAPYYDRPYCEGMPEHAENALANGVALTPRTLMCVAYLATHKHRSPKAALVHTPLVLSELGSEKNRQDLEITALRGASNIYFGWSISTPASTLGTWPSGATVHKCWLKWAMGCTTARCSKPGMELHCPWTRRASIRWRTPCTSINTPPYTSTRFCHCRNTGDWPWSWQQRVLSSRACSCKACPKKRQTRFRCRKRLVRRLDKLSRPNPGNG